MSEYCMYLRKSRADIEAEARGEGETLTRHQNMLLDLAKKQGLNIVKIYKEIVSGDSIAARPQMQALLADISEGKYTGVLVVEIERLARGDTIDQGIVAQAFKQSGTKIITPTKTYDPDNEFDEEYFEFSLFMSRREYKTIKRRMQAGRLAAIKEGNYLGTSAPYGYKKIQPEPKVHTLEIIPEEAEIVRMVYADYLDGHGAKFIAEKLNKLGISPQKSQFWEAPSIKKMLANPLYCGLIGWKTKSNGDTLYKGLHEAIISRQTFDAAQRKKKTNPAAQVGANNSLLNYYHGIMYCKNCGHQMRRRWIKASEHEHLLCTHRECRGKVVSASFEAIDEAVISALIFRLTQLDDLEGDPEAAAAQPTNKKAPLEAELSKAKKQLSRMYDLLEQDIYDANTFLERSKVVTQRISSLEAALKELATEAPRQRLTPEEARNRLTKVIADFPTADPAEKNRLLRSVVNKIYYIKTSRMCRNNKTSDLALEVDFL